MGCFCSCFRVPVEEDGGAVVVASGSQNRAPFSYMAQFFDNKYGVVSGNPSSAQTEVRTNTPQTEVRTNTQRDASTESSSSSRNLEFQRRVAVEEPGRGLRFLQLEHGPPEGHDVATPEAGSYSMMHYHVNQSFLRHNDCPSNLDFQMFCSQAI